MIKFTLKQTLPYLSINPDIYKKIVAAKVYIDSHFGESLDLDMISRQACLSRYHFHRLFSRIYGTTPHQYLTRRRIGQARLLLADKTLTISEICTHVGFESPGSFSMLFKKESGFPPQHYRRRAWEKQQREKAQPRVSIPHCFIDQYSTGGGQAG